MTSDLDWTEDGPRSREYGDVYFSTVDGLAESRAVFLDGCDLPHAWAGRDRFTVAELGFGTGLNVAALLQLWRRTGPPRGRLQVFSAESHLIGRDEAARALAGWRGDLGEEIDALLQVWPPPRRGAVRLDLPGFGAVLDLHLGEVGEALARWSGPADAWFLDGFAPSRNPQMWRDEVLAAVGRLSAPDARLASFTVAGRVRRGLAAAGFAVAKRPGFGAKRERLEGRRAAAPTAAPRPRHAVVIGGGIAGAALARAFAAEGLACTVVERAQPGAGASGNPAALVTPRLDAGFGPPAELHAQAFARAVDLYRRTTPQARISEGALQLDASGRGPDRFARLAAWDGFAPDALQPLPSADAAAALREAAAADPGAAALRIRDALVVEPDVVLAAWLQDASVIQALVARVERTDAGWICRDAADAVVAEADALVLAAGAEAERLVPRLGLRPVRGQAEVAPAPVFDGVAAAWGAYAIPLRGGGVLYGASHVRGDAGLEPREAETAANLRALAARRPALAARVEALAPGVLDRRVGVRAATPDHLPLAGRLEPGLFVLGGLGGRGFTLAPLLAEHMAAQVVGAPSPLPVDLAARLSPGRFRANP